MQLNGLGQVVCAGTGSSTTTAELAGDAFNLALPDVTAIEFSILVPDAAGGDSFAQLVVESGTPADHKVTIYFDRKNGSNADKLIVYYQYDGTFGYVEEAYSYGASMTSYRLEASANQVILLADGSPAVTVPLAGFAGLMQFDAGAYINVQMRTQVGYSISMDGIKVEGIV